MRVDTEVLHHLLLCELLAAFDRLDPDERVRVDAQQRGEHVVIALCGGGPERESADGERLAGRGLSLALAQELLARGGGSARASNADGQRRTELSIPLA